MCVYMCFSYTDFYLYVSCLHFQVCSETNVTNEQCKAIARVSHTFSPQYGPICLFI